MCFLGEGLFVKANRHKEIPARNGVSLSDVFCVVYVVQYIAKNCFSKYCSRHCTTGVISDVPGRAHPPGNLRITPTQRKLALKLFSNKTPAFNMEQLNVTELETMDVTMKKGFLESSEEFVSMIPFKAHARGLAAYEER